MKCYRGIVASASTRSVSDTLRKVDLALHEGDDAHLSP